MVYKRLFLVCSVLWSSYLFGQNQSIFSKSPKIYEAIDTTAVQPLKKRPWLAASEVFGLNMGVWAFDRYVLRGDWAYINKNTMKRNLKMGFYWDNDNFQTNLFNHPYHGALYFDAARSNGMNYYQSGLYSLGGSLMWEMFMECELPSKNDLVATSIGGMALGETFFRVSDLPLDNRATGWNRFGREALGLILSPTRGLTRIITGDAWKKSRVSGKQFPHPDIEFVTAVGIKSIELRDDIFDEGVGACVDLGMMYGDLYQSEDTKPYDYFTIRGSFNLQKDQPLIGQLNLMGRLWGEELWRNQQNELHWGIFQHFDYYDSDTISDISQKKPYEIGTPACFGAGLIFKGQNLSKTFKYRAYTHLNAIILGGSMSDYYYEDERGYNWGSGYSIKVGGGISYKEKLALSIGFENYRIFTWNGYDPDVDLSKVDFRTLDAQGDKSNAQFNILKTGFYYQIKGNWSIGLNEFLFVRRTNYAYTEDISSTTQETRLIATYSF